MEVSVGAEGVRYSTIASEQPNLSRFVVARGLSAEAYGERFVEWRDDGRRPIDLDMFVDGSGDRRFTTVWAEDSNRPGWAAFRQMSQEQLEAKLAERLESGMRPIRINAATFDGSTEYVAVWVADGNTDYRVAINVTGEEYSTAWATNRDDGYRPIDISAHHEGGLRYNGIWIKGDTRSWFSYREMSEEGLWARRIDLKSKNFALIDLDAYYLTADATELSYTAVFARVPARNRLASNTPATGTDIDDLNTLLDGYTGSVGFLVEDLTNGNYLGFNHHEHFYLASTAKVFIGAAVLDMIDRGVEVGDAALTLDTTLPFTPTDWRQNADTTNSGMVVGQSYTVDQYLGWMINNSSTGSTDLLANLVGFPQLDRYVGSQLGLEHATEITTICELDQRILEPWDDCVTDVPCHIFEPWWRDSSTSDPDYADYQDCLGAPGSLRRPDSDSYDDLYASYYETLANSTTPAEFATFWRSLLDYSLFEDPVLTQRYVEILDATGNGSVDDSIISRGFFNGLGGKHGGKRSARSWVGLAWFRNDSESIADATFQYSVSIFTENWASSSDGDEAKTVITQSLGLIFQYLDSQR